MAYSFSDFTTALQQNIIYPCFKYELLNPDESVSEDITSYVINSSNNNLQCTYQQGERTTANISFINIDKTWLPNSNGNLWLRSKIKITCGILMPDGTPYYPSDNIGGVFVVRNPQVLHNYSDMRATIQLSDKMCLLNGECGGELGTDYIVPNGTTIPTAVKAVLTLMGDYVSPIIDPSFSSTICPYTLRLTGDQTAYDVLLKLANITSANIYYDCNGIFRYEKGVYDILDTQKSSIWDFDIAKRELFNNTMSWNFDASFNQVIVLGTNMSNNSGNPIVQATCTNNNALSDLSVAYTNGVPRVKRISDTTINNSTDCQNRALWEMKKLIMMAITGDVSCQYLPQLQVNSVVSTINDSYFNFIRQRFLIKQYSLSLSTDTSMKLQLCNTNELNFSVS